MGTIEKQVKKYNDVCSDCFFEMMAEIKEESKEKCYIAFRELIENNKLSVQEYERSYSELIAPLIFNVKYSLKHLLQDNLSEKVNEADFEDMAEAKKLLKATFIKKVDNSIENIKLEVEVLTEKYS